MQTVNSDAPLFWAKAMEESWIAHIPNKSENQIVLGLGSSFDGAEEGEFAYTIGAIVTSLDDVPNGYVCKTIATNQYAVFTAKGKMPEAVQSVWQYIIQDWAPTMENRIVFTHNFEWYDERCRGLADDEIDIYIPIL
jgi:predicted transcriptional regulator YdeE